MLPSNVVLSCAALALLAGSVSAELPSELDHVFEGDIIATYASVKAHYGEDVAKSVLNEGLLVDNEGADVTASPTTDNDDDDEQDGDRRLGAPSISDSGIWQGGVIYWHTAVTGIRGAVRDALAELSDRTGLIFDESPSGFPDASVEWIGREKGYIGITSEEGCSSVVGKWSSGREQGMSLGSGCLAAGTVQHEFLHAAGMWHEQAMFNRDDFVTIIWDNIDEEREKNFNKRLSTDDLGVPYDYGSVMHYGPQAFAARKENGISVTTIMTKDPTKQNMIGSRTLSMYDCIQTQLMYHCALQHPQDPVSEWRPRHLGSLCDEDCPCDVGQGHCEQDSHCKGSLVCAPNINWYYHRGQEMPYPSLNVCQSDYSSYSPGSDGATGSPPTPSPSGVVSDPFCEDGVRGENAFERACCPASCAACDDEQCSDEFDGRCCAPTVLVVDASCQSETSPCVMDPSALSAFDSRVGVDGDGSTSPTDPDGGQISAMVVAIGVVAAVGMVGVGLVVRRRRAAAGVKSNQSLSAFRRSPFEQDGRGVSTAAALTGLEDGDYALGAPVQDKQTLAKTLTWWMGSFASLKSEDSTSGDLDDIEANLSARTPGVSAKTSSSSMGQPKKKSPPNKPNKPTKFKTNTSSVGDRASSSPPRPKTSSSPTRSVTRKEGRRKSDDSSSSKGSQKTRNKNASTSRKPERNKKTLSKAHTEASVSSKQQTSPRGGKSPAKQSARPPVVPARPRRSPTYPTTKLMQQPRVSSTNPRYADPGHQNVGRVSSGGSVKQIARQFDAVKKNNNSDAGGKDDARQNNPHLVRLKTTGLATWKK